MTHQEYLDYLGDLLFTIDKHSEGKRGQIVS